MPLSLNGFSLRCGNNFMAVGMCLHCSFLLSVSLSLGRSGANWSSRGNWTKWTKGGTPAAVYYTTFITSHKQVISYQNLYIFSFLFTASFLPPLCLGCTGITWTSGASWTSWQASKCPPRTGCPGNILSVCHLCLLTEQRWYWCWNAFRKTCNQEVGALLSIVSLWWGRIK